MIVTIGQILFTGTTLVGVSFFAGSWLNVTNKRIDILAKHAVDSYAKHAVHEEKLSALKVYNEEATLLLKGSMSDLAKDLQQTDKHVNALVLEVGDIKFDIKDLKAKQNFYTEYINKRRGDNKENNSDGQ